ncbi:hypothetical protein WKY82_10385 [Gordonia malaquae]|uniref:hypothetical protein n=1 Tax=Gordonia malaquae TaxID=410332 RepID=UPI0030C79C53
MSRADDPHRDLARSLHRQREELLALAEGKFEFIRTLQGAVLDKPDDLTLVVNAHGAVLGELVKKFAVLSSVVESLVDSQGRLIHSATDDIEIHPE